MFADLAAPLHKCAHQGTAFIWSPEAEVSFKKLKEAITTAPVLAYPDPKHPFVLDTDASGVAIEAVLSQRERPVAYFSHILSGSQRNYCVTHKELLAVVEAIKRFHPYLYGQSFIVRTDHAALRWLLEFRNPEGQVARWLETLQAYDFTMEHCAGQLHSNANALSRCPCKNCQHCDKLEHLEAHMPPVEPSVNAVTLGNGNIESYSPKEIRQAQSHDDDLKLIMALLERQADSPGWEEVAASGGATKAYWAQWQSLRVENGLLYCLWESSSGDSITKQLVVPRVMRKTVLANLHGTVSTGHFGVANKTLGRLRERYYWVNCRQDVEDCCHNCDTCAQKRGPPRKQQAAMKKYTIGLPMERIALDIILGPLPVTDYGNRHILVVSDYFTKCVEAFPMPDQEASTVAELLVKEVVCRFGVPLIIHSDQGRNFKSAVFTEVCELLGMQKTRTTAYHPQSDGIVERFNRTLENQLSRFVSDHQRDWDNYIPYIYCWHIVWLFMNLPGSHLQKSYLVLICVFQ